MALEKYRLRGLYDKHNAPLSNEDIKKEIKKVEKVVTKTNKKDKKHG